MTITSEILEVVKNLPGVTSGEIVEFMPHVKAQTVYAQLHSMYVRGELARETDSAAKDGRGRPPYKWSINVDGKPPVPVRKVTPMTFKIPSSAIIEQLNARVAELEQWKADAIARYPDLAVDPLVLKARQMVAEEIGDIDTTMRDAVLRGERDGVLAIRVAVKLLEGVAL